MSHGTADPGVHAGDGPAAGGFGDEGVFPDTQPAGEPGRGVHWPTVLAAGGVAAVISAIIVTIGVVGMHRPAAAPTAAPQPVVVTVDSAAAPVALEETDEIDPDAEGTDAEGEVPADPAPAATPIDSAPVAQTDPAPAAPAEESGTGGWTPPSPLPDDYTVTSAEPSLTELNNLVYFLVATGAPDAAKARNLEGGQSAVIVPTTVYRMGLFRAPRGWSRVSGPIEGGGDRVTARLHAFSAGMPDVSIPIVFVRQDGNWRLSSDSLCQGVRTLGLPIYCNG